MEEKIVIAVCGYPELYDTTCLLYRDLDQCRKKWKSLRDTYLKERRKEAEKKSRAAAGPVKRWKYSAVLSFLDPFITPRETSGNMGRGVEDRAAEYRESEAGPVEDKGEAAGPSGIESGDHQALDSPNSSDTEPAPAASPTDGPASGSSSGPATAPAAARGRAPNSMVTRRARKRGREDGETRQSQIEELLLEALKRQAQPGPPAPPDPPRQPPSEDEMFLLSLVPSLQRLSPQRKEYVKFHIHKLIFEASPVVLNFEHCE
ncbi:uncharacterized protein LOC125891537 [Epinephelus fuscoguttatus]|uniref:uncharacterized protein LOC125891537 n=1 Tax=Epinephelus fuscoguttatus TaxID=293821 RepID=UPI0020D12AEE|nr:uncharacterized protein LOC125891537 [Epinephelus fuscoguttatus]